MKKRNPLVYVAWMFLGAGLLIVALNGIETQDDRDTNYKTYMGTGSDNCIHAETERLSDLGYNQAQIKAQLKVAKLCGLGLTEDQIDATFALRQFRSTR